MVNKPRCSDDGKRPDVDYTVSIVFDEQMMNAHLEGDAFPMQGQLRPWLSHNCLRQAFLAFDMDSPADMPQRPIVQITKIGSTTVTMEGKRMATIKCFLSQQNG